MCVCVCVLRATYYNAPHSSVRVVRRDGVLIQDAVDHDAIARDRVQKLAVYRLYFLARSAGWVALGAAAASTLLRGTRPR